MITVKYPRPENITKNMKYLTTVANNKSLSEVSGQNYCNWSWVELMKRAYS